MAAGLDARVAKTCLDSSVGEWSAKTRKASWFVLSCFAFSGLDSCAHNPEVVGSSPASATKELLKSRDFRSSSFYPGQNVGSFSGRTRLTHTVTHLRKCQIESLRPGIVHRQPQGVFVSCVHILSMFLIGYATVVTWAQVRGSFRWKNAPWEKLDSHRGRYDWLYPCPLGMYLDFEITSIPDLPCS